MYRCNDLTVPFPTAAISDTDPFADHEAHPFPMMVDEDHIVRSWAPSGRCNDHLGENDDVVGLRRATETDASSPWGEKGKLDAAAAHMSRPVIDGGCVPRTMFGNDVDVDADGQGFEKEDGSEGEDSPSVRGGQEILRLSDGDVDIGVTMRRIRPPDTKEPGQVVRKRPKYPPFLFARYPYTYVSHLVSFSSHLARPWRHLVPCRVARTAVVAQAERKSRTEGDHAQAEREKSKIADGAL